MKILRLSTFVLSGLLVAIFANLAFSMDEPFISFACMVAVAGCAYCAGCEVI